MTTWRKLLEEEFQIQNDSWKNIVMMAPSDGKWLDYYFDNDSNVIEGVPFTVWTKNRVYFPLSFDGSEWVGSVSKIPNGIATAHLSY